MNNGFWINQLTNNDYTEGDKPSQFHIPVIQRPDWTYDWNGNAWIQNAGRVTQTQSLAQDTIDLATIKADNQVTTFLALSPVQVTTWIDTNVTNLAGAIVALKILAKAVLVLARRSLR